MRGGRLLVGCISDVKIRLTESLLLLFPLIPVLAPTERITRVSSSSRYGQRVSALALVSKLIRFPSTTAWRSQRPLDNR